MIFEKIFRRVATLNCVAMRTKEYSFVNLSGTLLLFVYVFTPRSFKFHANLDDVCLMAGPDGARVQVEERRRPDAARRS